MNMNNTCANSPLSPRQKRIYNTSRRLWTEHVMWTRSFIVSTAFELPDLDAVTKRLLRNPVDLANFLRPFYSNQIAKKIEELFTEHLLIAAQLVNAAKRGDANAVEAERKKWYANADDIASFLSSINPYWDKKTWQMLLYDHLKMTENEAVLTLKGQYTDSIAQYDKIAEQALTMADVMSCGIFRQFRI